MSEDKRYTHLSLFSGIGGLDLAAEWAGFETVGQCEWADYPTKVLEKHWPAVPRWRDIRTLTKEAFYEKTGLHTVDVISGGFPCQPFSVAGKQKGKGDDRYRWPEMRRVIRELKPRWVIGENVPGILRIAAADVVADLEREGYDVVVFDFEAAAVGAPHRRERIAFVANRHNAGDRTQRYNPHRNRSEDHERRRERPQPELSGYGEAVVDADDGSQPLRRDRKLSDYKSFGSGGDNYRDRKEKHGCGEWWAAEPDVGRVAHGIPNRVDRLKCLGNAVVPQQFYPIFKAIMEVERNVEF